MDQNIQEPSPYKGGRMNGWARGMDNRRSNIDIPADVLRNTVNVDVLTSGKIRRRRGIGQVVADSGAHSVFSDGDRIVWATANTLKIATPNFVKTTLLTDARLAQPLSYVELNGEIYFSNEAINGKIDAFNTVQPWGIVPPAAAPVCVSTDSGTKNRQYQVTCTFVLASGEESGAPIGIKVLCSDAPIISMSSIPQSSDARVVATRIYVTDIDGEDFFGQVNVPAGVVSWAISGFFGVGEVLKTQFMVPPIPGQFLDYTNGRIYIASGNNVYMTQPNRYGLVNLGAPGTPIHDYFMFPQRVTLMKTVDDGVFVAADLTYYIDHSGEAKADQTPVLPYTAIEGVSCDIPNSRDVMWLSPRGFILGKRDGTVKNLTEDRIAVDFSLRGCMGFVEQNGVKKVVAIMRESTPNPLVAAEYVEAETERVMEIK